MEIQMVTDEIKTQQMDVMWKYVILSYLLFWFMVMALGGSAAMVFNAPPLVQRIVEAFCAWAPTFAFLIMFKKLRPETNLKDFVKSVFSQKLRLDLMLVSGVAVVLSSIVPLLILSFSEGQSFTSFFSLKGYSLPVTLLLCLFAGPLGEELGWRGYLRVELDKKYSFIQASIVAGVIWAFWHAILWFVDVAFMDGATGLPLVIYIIANVVVMTSLVIIMNVVMQRSNNLLNAIWIHLCYNVIFYHLTNINLAYFGWLTIVYAITGALFLLYHYGYFSRGKIVVDEMKF
jgi:membrane protease YdiL (CAAX protease family)